MQQTILDASRFQKLRDEVVGIVADWFVSAEVASTALPIKPGDLLFAGSGETHEEIGI